MILSKQAHQVGRFVADNSPAILTGMAVTGVVATAVLSGRGAYLSADRLRTYKDGLDKLEGRDKLIEQVRLVWPLYIPATCVGATTIGCVIMANRIGDRRAAAMAAAYSLSEKAFVEYREKVAETFSTNKERKIRDEVAQDRVNSNPPGKNEIVVVEDGQVICHDAYSGRYFKSNMELLKKSQNSINRDILSIGYASLSDLYELWGLSRTSVSDDLGWQGDFVELRFSVVLTEDQRPCISVAFDTEPIRKFYKFN